MSHFSSDVKINMIVSENNQKQSNPRISSWTLVTLLFMTSSVVGDMSQNFQSSVCVKEDSVCIPQNYSKLDLPNETLTKIGLGIDIKDIPKIDYIDFGVTLNAILRLTWIEPRLAIDEEKIYQNMGLEKENSSVDIHSISVDVSFIKNLWLPDLEILNLKEFQSKEVLSKLEGLWLKKLEDKFWIYYTLATKITFNCPMTFTNFPLDIQICLFQVSTDMCFI